MPRVTIALTPREKFYVAPECLERILRHTKIPFNLVIVNCEYPQKYWQAMEALIQGHDNVKVLWHARPLLPNESRNLVIPECRDELLCLIENDMLVNEGWLEELIEALDEEAADVVVPLLMEGRSETAQPHFDDSMGFVRTRQTVKGIQLEILPRPVKKEADVGTTARRTEEFLETHVILFRREVFEKIGLFDPGLSASDDIDLSLSLLRAGLRIVYDPRCVLNFIQPTYPLPLEDKALFEVKWSFKKAKQSLKRIQEKWNLVSLPKNVGFMAERYYQGMGLLHDELARVVRPGEKFILVDNGQWVGTEVVEGLNVLSFKEHDGEYWGPPKDDGDAISELERLRTLGASSMIFVWHGLWHLDFYKGFNKYLKSNYPCRFHDHMMLGFDLRRSILRTAG